MSSLEPQTTAKVVLETTKGEIELELWAKEIPKISRMFIQNCLDKKYVGDTYEKIIKDYIIQTNPSDDKSSFDLKDEFHSRIRFNKKGLLCAIKKDVKKKNGNSIDSFFITMKETPEFSNVYVVFGKIVGNSIYNIMKINNSELNSNNQPIYPTKILDVKVPLKYFEDLVESGSSIEVKPPKKKQKKEKKKKIKLSYEVDEDDIAGPDSNFKMKSAHELLNDKKLLESLTPTEKDYNGEDSISALLEDHSSEINPDQSYTVNTPFVKENDDGDKADRNTLVGKEVEISKQRNSDVDSDYDSNLDLSDNDIGFKYMMNHKFI